MFHYVYFIESISSEEYYIGYSTNLRQRIQAHNEGKNRSTKRYKPWRLIFYEAYRDEHDAKRREKYLKTSQGSRALKRMLKEYFYEKRSI